MDLWRGGWESVSCGAALMWIDYIYTPLTTTYAFDSSNFWKHYSHELVAGAKKSPLPSWIKKSILQQKASFWVIKGGKKDGQNYSFLGRWMHIILNVNVSQCRFIWTWYLNSRPRDVSPRWMRHVLGLSTTRIWKPNSKLWSQQQHIWKLITNVTSSVAILVDSFVLVTKPVSSDIL